MHHNLKLKMSNNPNKLNPKINLKCSRAMDLRLFKYKMIMMIKEDHYKRKLRMMQMK